MNSSGDANTWEVAIAQGLRGEQLAAPALHSFLGFEVTHANALDHRAVDLEAAVNIDIKILRSPFSRSPTSAGLHAANHVTLDYANIVKYPPNTWIWCIIDYTKTPDPPPGSKKKKVPPQPTKGIYHITAGRVMEIIAAHPERIYLRTARTFQDKEKKIGISIAEMGRITFPGLDSHQSADLFLQ